MEMSQKLNETARIWKGDKDLCHHFALYPHPHLIS
jgi:hypothetical protein